MGKVKTNEGREKEKIKNAETSIASFPGLPQFLPSICVHNNARERKTGEKRKGLGAFIT